MVRFGSLVVGSVVCRTRLGQLMSYETTCDHEMDTSTRFCHDVTETDHEHSLNEKVMKTVHTAVLTHVTVV